MTIVTLLCNTLDQPPQIRILDGSFGTGDHAL